MENLDRRREMLIRKLLAKEESLVRNAILVQKIFDIAYDIRDTDGINEREYNRAEKIINICNAMGIG